MGVVPVIVLFVDDDERSTASDGRQRCGALRCDLMWGCSLYFFFSYFFSYVFSYVFSYFSDLLDSGKVRGYEVRGESDGWLDQQADGGGGRCDGSV